MAVILLGYIIARSTNICPGNRLMKFGSCHGIKLFILQCNPMQNPSNFDDGITITDSCCNEQHEINNSRARHAVRMRIRVGRTPSATIQGDCSFDILLRMDFSKNKHAGGLFDGIASRYDLFSQLFSFFQTGSWRRFLLSRLQVRPGDTVLDICTGTAGVAVDIAGASRARVVGVDLSGGMLRLGQKNVAKAGLEDEIGLLLGRAEALAFADSSFDAVCFTYLLRYVEDPRTTLGEIVRVLKPGGSLVSLDFAVPRNLVVRNLWNAYTRLVLPLATSAMSPGWRRLGTFLSPNILGFYRSYSIEDIGRMWVDVGISDVRVKRLSLGGGVVMWGTKTARSVDSG